ncbi:MAG: hypothetical protein JNK85_17705 [Verrucomicrobiales bacterium]|nr:hypothetical protein [Verrucomicrobiales bacterium]
MTTPWTPTARRELESILDDLRPTLTETGADPDEVLDDLRRHVSEEASAARLTVVTEADVRRLVERVAPTPRLEDFGRRQHRNTLPSSASPRTHLEPPTTPASTSTSPKPPSTGKAATIALWIFGVFLPAVTLMYEAVTGSCAAELFDPLPTTWHAFLVATVPIGNALVLWIRRTHGGAGNQDTVIESAYQSPMRRSATWLWAANGTAVAVSSFYALAFVPAMPMALIAVVFVLGLFALAPMAAWFSSMTLRRWLSKSMIRGAETRRLRYAWWAGFALAGLGLVGMALPTVQTRHYSRVAAGETVASTAALRWLRTHGNREQLLRDCYGYRPGIWYQLVAGNTDIDAARRLFFQVTGQPFNAVPAPKAIQSRRLTGFLANFDVGGVEWDAGLGGDTVAGLVRGLSLASSRMDVVCDPDAAWSYTEWTLEFRNDHPQQRREARAQIQLPHGGVVSRLTLWVDGEEREAAFAGRSDTRDAYRKVAVVERRDPVLVTTSGPDRVLLQCFPIPPGSGTMKVRLGITAPMALIAADRAVLSWPVFSERNFGIRQTLRHATWVESSRQPVQPREGWSPSPGGEGRTALRGEWSESQMADALHAVVFSRSSSVADSWSPSRSESRDAWVHARVQSAPPRSPSRLALVLDGSGSMTEHFPAIAEAVASLPKSLPITVFAAKDGVQRLAPEAIPLLKGEGGQDDVPALLAAWEWAAEVPGSQVVWIHGPYPTVIGSIEQLRQRLDWRTDSADPALLDLAVQPGPNRIVEALDGLDSVSVVPRLGTLAEDLMRLFASWQEPTYHSQISLEHASATTTVPDPRWHRTAGHLARLWAQSEIRRLWRDRRRNEATALANRYQLVTPASGAVVLETQAQFTQAGLHPADPTTVPVVPEPGLPRLLAIGLLALLLFRRRVRLVRRP